MKIETANLITIAEASRRLNTPPMPIYKAVKDSALIPDAVAGLGRIHLFNPARLEEIRNIVTAGKRPLTV